MKQKDQNRDLWVGFRPSVIVPKKKDKRQERNEGKRLCRNAKQGHYEE